MIKERNCKRWQTVSRGDLKNDIINKHAKRSCEKNMLIKQSSLSERLTLSDVLTMREKKEEVHKRLTLDCKSCHARKRYESKAKCSESGEMPATKRGSKRQCSGAPELIQHKKVALYCLMEHQRQVQTKTTYYSIHDLVKQARRWLDSICSRLNHDM